MKACIFDIKRFAIHDGPGIRVTLFFKGCPLSCWWCHNPEGIPRGIETHSETVEFDGIQIEREVQVGRWMDTEDLVREIEKDKIFMDESGGGVTFSGGEPLLQAEALLNLLDICSGKGIHTAVDTSGYSSGKVVQEVSDKADLILYDLKSMNDDKHREFTGISNRKILENLELALRGKSRIIVRIPLIPGFNQQPGDLEALLDYLKGLEGIEEVDILPYHRYADHKYIRFKKNMRMDEITVPSANLVEDARQRFESAGFTVKTGG